jgi:hypothetical protein
MTGSCTSATVGIMPTVSRAVTLLVVVFSRERKLGWERLMFTSCGEFSVRASGDFAALLPPLYVDQAAL